MVFFTAAGNADTVFRQIMAAYDVLGGFVSMIRLFDGCLIAECDGLPTSASRVL